MSVRGPFKRRGRTVVVGLPADQRAIMARLLGDVDALLDDGTADAATPRDPLAELVGVHDGWLADLEGSLGGGGADGPAADDVRTAAERFEDPALARLLPDAANDDPAVAAEFRRLTEHGLRARKRSSLTLAQQALRRPDPVVLDATEAQALLKGLTDVRLVVAERLGLRTDEDAEAVHALLARAGDADSPWLVLAGLYDTLTWWQEALVRELPR